MKSLKKPMQRITALLMAAVMAIGLLPTFTIEAQAADAPASITLKSCTFHNKKYTSPKLGTSWYEYFQFNVNGTNTPGFCMNKGKMMRNAFTGQKWKQEKKYEVKNQYLERILNWYYTSYYGSLKIDADPAHKNKSFNDKVAVFPDYMSYDMRKWNAAWVQICVWLDVAGNVPADKNAAITLFVNEMKAVLKAYFPSADMTKDPQFDKNQRDRLTLMLDDTYAEATYTKHEFYRYVHATNPTGIQGILTAIPTNDPPTIPEKYSVWITFDKVDENNQPLAGAVFNVRKSDYTEFYAQITTTGTAGTVYEIPLTEAWQNNPRGTLVLAEESAPQGYERSDCTYTVDVDVNMNNTKANPAKVEGDGEGKIINDSSTTTTPGDPGTPNSILSKVDAATGKGVGPATFHFEGQAADGSAVNADFDCDANGTLDLQWTNPAGDKYIKPGQYTVTEKTPPEGYESTDEAQHLVLSIDAQGNGVSSGPIQFRNHKKKKLLIKKVSDDGTPLKGAIFKVSLDGRELLTQATDDNGELVYDGDGNGIQTGLYTIEEITPPAGYLLPETTIHNIYVDAENPDIKEYVVTVTNSTYPEIKIRKVDKETGDPLPGTTFEVMIDGTPMNGDFTTAEDGTIIIDHATYGKFLDMTKQSWTVSVREKSATTFYNRDNKDWQTVELRNGQTLATFEFEDTHYRDIKVYKRDTRTNAPLKDATFRLRCIALEDPATGGGTANYEGTTDENGVATFVNLPNGTYELTEEIAPPGYQKTTRKETIVITSDSPRELEVYLHQ